MPSKNTLTGASRVMFDQLPGHCSSAKSIKWTTTVLNTCFPLGSLEFGMQQTETVYLFSQPSVKTLGVEPLISAWLVDNPHKFCPSFFLGEFNTSCVLLLGKDPGKAYAVIPWDFGLCWFGFLSFCSNESESGLWLGGEFHEFQWLWRQSWDTKHQLWRESILGLHSTETGQKT